MPEIQNSSVNADYIVVHRDKVQNMMIRRNEGKLLEIQTRSGHVITIFSNSNSKSEKITLTRSGLKGNCNLVEMNIDSQSVSVSTIMNLSIKANNIEIEARESMKIKSGDIMTINGSLVKIN